MNRVNRFGLTAANIAALVDVGVLDKHEGSRMLGLPPSFSTSRAGHRSQRGSSDPRLADALRLLDRLVAKGEVPELLAEERQQRHADEQAMTRQTAQAVATNLAIRGEAKRRYHQ